MARGSSCASLARYGPDHWHVEPLAAGRAVEVGVAEGEDSAVSCDQPVALAIRGGGHADDRPVQVNAAEIHGLAGVSRSQVNRRSSLAWRLLFGSCLALP